MKILNRTLFFFVILTLFSCKKFEDSKEGRYDSYLHNLYVKGNHDKIIEEYLLNENSNKSEMALVYLWSIDFKDIKHKIIQNFDNPKNNIVKKRLIEYYYKIISTAVFKYYDYDINDMREYHESEDQIIDFLDPEYKFMLDKINEWITQGNLEEDSYNLYANIIFFVNSAENIKYITPHYNYLNGRSRDLLQQLINKQKTQ